jgi:hypothetical protein
MLSFLGIALRFLHVCLLLIRLDAQVALVNLYLSVNWMELLHLSNATAALVTVGAWTLKVMR